MGVPPQDWAAAKAVAETFGGLPLALTHIEGTLASLAGRYPSFAISSKRDTLGSGGPPNQRLFSSTSVRSQSFGT